jgi:ASC-1-like (ASCH) protein
MKSGDLLVFNKDKRFVKVYKIMPHQVFSAVKPGGKFAISTFLVTVLQVGPMHSYVMLIYSGDEVVLRWVDNHLLSPA